MAEPKLKDVLAKVDELQTAVDLEQQQVKDLLAEKDATNTSLQTTITGLNEVITTLQGQVADGGTPEERQAIIDKIIALKDDVESTVEGTPPPPPPPPDEV